jgi:hypothetical protein
MGMTKLEDWKMSKFLKFIVNVFLIAAILTAAAILVPPILGIQTTIIDSATMDTNLPMGSITYATDIQAADVKVGDEILKDDNASTYAYMVKEANPEDGNFTVVSASEQDGQPETITLRNQVPKVAVIVPYIGYVIIAMHSMEGIMIIALVVVLMIILFILSELWKDRSDEEEEPEDDQNSDKLLDVDEVTIDDVPEIKPDIHADDRILETEEEDLPLSELSTAELPKAADSAWLDADVEAADEVDRSEDQASADDDSQLTAAEEEQQSEALQGLAAEAEEASKDSATESKEVPQGLAAEEAAAGTPQDLAKDAATSAEAQPDADEISNIYKKKADPNQEKRGEVSSEETLANTHPEIDLSDAIEHATLEAEEKADQKAVQNQPTEAAGDETQILDLPDDQTGETQDEEEPDEQQADHFVPVERATLNEILDQAKKDGDEPDVIKDDTTGITIVDYSRII